MKKVVQVDRNNRYKELMDSNGGRHQWSFDASM